MITNFNLYEKLLLDDVVIDVTTPDKPTLDEIIEKFSIIIEKRIKRNLRIIKINGSMNDLQLRGKERKTFTDLEIVMSNKDKIKIKYTYSDSIDTKHKGEIELMVNDKLIYNVEKLEFTPTKWVEKVAEEYKKYLKNEKWKIQ